MVPILNFSHVGGGGGDIHMWNLQGGGDQTLENSECLKNFKLK